MVTLSVTVVYHTYEGKENIIGKTLIHLINQSKFLNRSPILPGSAEHKDEMDEPLGTSPPLELRRPTSAPRSTIAIPHSLQSPQDRGE